ncbi:protein of unknown function [endosymbiont DhMRE of Dentiscutata heterogama]|uniref:hypothetical protein n=1 Tax=endosymbiont DhMRE of Dentiscutata heterogama TaxID=1609546 RepID=UPI000629D25A|nr:hypothetical protein [endosymbiont DhMRE of Dentiscutata heterogama]CFW92960.1 protein of unknown function [endosymbiont DhMRE of Dentiscutata heterogama]
MPENQDLIKLLQESQKTNRIATITSVCTVILGSVTTLILAWKSLFQKKRPSAALRLIRIEAAMARLQLEKEHLKKEIAHEAERLKLETGLQEDATSEETDLVGQHQKYLADKVGLADRLKQQGANLFQRGVGQVKKVGDKVNQFTSLLDKESDKKEKK